MFDSEAGRLGGAPLSFSAVVDRAFEAYGARAALYAGLAAAGFAVQAGIDLAVHGDAAPYTLLGVNYAVDAFISTVVTLGTAAQISGDDSGAGTLLRRSLARLPAVAIVSAFVLLAQIATQSLVFGSLSETAYGFAILPVLALWGPLACASVVAATGSPSVLGSVAKALYEPFALGLRRENFGRVVLLAAVTLPVAMLQKVLADQMALKHLGSVGFWANIPLDALTVGAYQAVFTVFWFDLVNRAKRAT